MSILSKKRHLILSLSLIVLTVGFIWINSALPGSESGQFSQNVRELLEKILTFINFPEAATAFLLENVRKVAHVTEYAVMGLELGFLWAGLKRGFQGLWNAFSTVLFIAVCDETIQLFALSRGPQITDVLLDTASATVMILTVYIIWLIIRTARGERDS